MSLKIVVRFLQYLTKNKIKYSFPGSLKLAYRDNWNEFLNFVLNFLSYHLLKIIGYFNTFLIQQ